MRHGRTAFRCAKHGTGIMIYVEEPQEVSSPACWRQDCSGNGPGCSRIYPIGSWNLQGRRSTSMKNLAVMSRQPRGLLLGPPKASPKAEQIHPSAVRSHKDPTLPILGTSPAPSEDKDLLSPYLSAVSNPFGANCCIHKLLQTTQFRRFT